MKFRIIYLPLLLFFADDVDVLPDLADELLVDDFAACPDLTELLSVERVAVLVCERTVVCVFG